jgi:hypothetical protein
MPINFKGNFVDFDKIDKTLLSLLFLIKPAEIIKLVACKYFLQTAHSSTPYKATHFLSTSTLFL